MFELSTINSLCEEPKVELDPSVSRDPVMFSGLALASKMELEEIMAEGDMLFATLEAINQFEGLALESASPEHFSMVANAIENASGGVYTVTNHEELVALEAGVYEGIGGFFKKLFDKIGSFFGNVHDGSRLAMEKLPALRARIGKAPKDFKYSKLVISFKGDMRPLVGVGEKQLVAWVGKSLVTTAKVAAAYDPVKFLAKIKETAAKSVKDKHSVESGIFESVIKDPMSIYPYAVTKDGKHGWDRFYSLVGTFYSGLYVRYDRNMPGYPLFTGTYYPTGANFDGIIDDTKQLAEVVDVAEKLFKAIENVDGIRKAMDAYEKEVESVSKGQKGASSIKYMGRFVVQFAVNQHEYLYDYAKALVTLADKVLDEAGV